MNIYIGTDGNSVYRLFQCVYMLHVDGKDDPFVYRVQVTDDAEEWVYNLDFVDYAALKAAWHPSQLTGAPENRCFPLVWSWPWPAMARLCSLAAAVRLVFACALDAEHDRVQA